MESGADQGRSTKCEDRRGRMQRAKPSESQMLVVEAELRPHQLGRDHDAHQEGRDAPEHGEDHRRAHDILDVVRHLPRPGRQYGDVGHAISPRVVRAN